jgi:hypothetical protein
VSLLSSSVVCTSARLLPLWASRVYSPIILYQRVASKLIGFDDCGGVQHCELPRLPLLSCEILANYPKALKPAKTGPFPAPYSPDLPFARTSAYPQIAPRPRLEAKA